MSLGSCSGLRLQQGSPSLDADLRSCQYTPVMQLDAASASSSSLQPRILQFTEQLSLLGLNIKKESIELLIGSRIYESFEFDPSGDQVNSLRTEQLFPDSNRKKSSPVESVESIPNSLSFHSKNKPRKDSLGYFCEQLAELKENVNKLITVINHRNPEERKQSPIHCLGDPSIQASAGKQSLDAKSTQSQDMKQHSLRLDRPISHFHSPAKRLESSLLDVSPIQHRTIEPQHHSNISDCSTRSLMRRKMRSHFDFSS